MRRVVRLIATMVPVLLAGCADPLHSAADRRLLPMAYLSSDESLLTELAPSNGDIAGFGGSLAGKLAAGAPGGAVLGLGGQLAGGNGVGKATGSTLGGLLGSMLGPLGSMIGSLFGGYIGEQTDSGNSRAVAAGPGYIDALDLGPHREKAS